MRQLSPRERGQALVEFSLVLPVLVIMTIGSILLGIYFTQRSTMTGITFIAAREAALSTDPHAAAARVHHDMARGGPGWLKDTQIKTQSGAGKVAVTMTHSGDMNVPLLANAGRAVSGPNSRRLDQFGEIRETVMMSSEVVRSTGGSRGPHPRTGTTVNYRHELTLGVDLHRIPGGDPLLLGQVAPQGKEMDQKARNAAASGCAESLDTTGPCAGIPANANLYGKSGFFEKMGYNPRNSTVSADAGKILDKRLTQLWYGHWIQKVGLAKAASVVAKLQGVSEAILSVIQVGARLAEESFALVARGTKMANDKLFTSPVVPLAQYQAGQGRQ